jgi:hypothetical protein
MFKLYLIGSALSLFIFIYIDRKTIIGSKTS